jgi:hypothetical protein
MKNDDVKIGSQYLAKVTDKVVPIRIDAENRNGGWDATNLATGKKIRIKSAQRLRGPAGKKKGKAEQSGEGAAAAVAPEATPKTKKPKQPKEDKPKRISALDSAAQVLREAKAPMRCKEMIAAMQTQGLWASPNGKTPEATLYSAILREITTKGDQSRFCKLERGLFQANS